MRKLTILKSDKLKQDGFTLIEVLVSLVLLAIVLTSFFSIFSQSLVFSGKNEEDLVAYNLATQTLKIVEANYQNLLAPSQTEFKIYSTNTTCSNYSTGYPPELTALPNPSTCYYNENQKNYYPEIRIAKQSTTDFTTPILFSINVKIYNINNISDPKRKLLSETFGYVRGK